MLTLASVLYGEVPRLISLVVGAGTEELLFQTEETKLLQHRVSCTEPHQN